MNSIETKNSIAFLSGDFTAHSKFVVQSLKNIDTLDFANVTNLDLISCAILIENFGLNTNIINANETNMALWNLAKKHYQISIKLEPKYGFLESVGRLVVELLNGAMFVLASIGQFASRVFKPFPLSSALHVVKEAGINALPVIIITSLLLGVVLAYQSAAQLQKFGANIFIADLVTISFIRELGPLIVAMLIAGRSGSAFTAKLGSMKLGEEIDAIKTMGLSPISLIVLPNIIGLMIALPLIVVISDFVGIFGGMLVAKFNLDVSFEAFIERMYNAVSVKHYLVGIAKAPFFAFFISFIGYHRGMCVEVSAESLGRETTNAVVQAIFAVVAFDALFSVFITRFGI